MIFDPYWEELHQTVEWHRVLPKQFVSFYDQHFSNYVDGLFLDIGCGTGPASWFVAFHRNWVVALDGSKTAIKKTMECSATAPNFSKYVLPIIADIDAIEFRPQSFDGVIDNCTIQSLPIEDAQRVLEKIRIWMKPQAWLYSKMACEPYEYARKDAPVRLLTTSDISKLFGCFTGNIEKSTSILLNGDMVTHYIFNVRGK